MTSLTSSHTGISFKTLKTSSGFLIGHILLDQPKTLNALTLPMIDAMAAHLLAWEQDDNIAAVMLSSTSKVFCAGGDVQKLTHAARANQAAGAILDTYAESFFEREYRLDYQLYKYSKPVLCWGHGPVMGGGLGLFSASSHRVVTESSVMAWPEITIGLFPDAGGSESLSRLPESVGLFLGLTGAPVRAADSMLLGIATHQIAHECWSDLLQELQNTKWHEASEVNYQQMSLTLNLFAVDVPSSAPDAVIFAQTEKLAEALSGQRTHQEIASALMQLGAESDWLARAYKTFRAGCPVTAGIVIEQLKRAQSLNLAQRLQMELVIASHCMRRPDFIEGVRALLIDKDKKPKWSYPALEDVPEAVIKQHFESNLAKSPLADLEGSS